VLIIVENRPAGLDNRVRKQIDSLVRSGYAVRAITQRHPGNGIYRAVPAVRLHEYRPPREPASLPGYLVEYGYSFLMAASLSAKILARERIDVVQFCQPPDVYFLLAWLFRLAGARVVVDQRDLLAELYAARYGQVRRGLLRGLHKLEKFSQRSADRILCVNEYLRRRALAASRLPPGRVSVVRNGPVLSQVAASTRDEALKRGRRYLCCWVGEIGRQDRVDLLIRSVFHVVRRLCRSDCQFVVIGDGECLGQAKSLAGELGIDDWVYFPGFLTMDQVFQYLATADLGVDASLQSEVSPVKAMEYMAFGLPFVAFDLPETRAISEGAADFAEPGDIEGHAKLIDALLEDPGRRRLLGQAGSARVRGELAWDHQAVTYIGVMEELCLARRPAREP
jgi:glycosyltransferase involved in cell wall biosynthesis